MVVREGISEEVTFKPYLPEVQETTGRQDSRQKEQHLQRPWAGRNLAMS